MMFSLNFGLLKKNPDLVGYQFSTFYYVWKWSKGLLWWVVGGVGGGGVESSFSVHLWSKP